MDVNYIENLRYTGFSPSYNHTLATKNLIYNNHAYNRNYYDEISTDKNTKIHYFNNVSRWKSNDIANDSEITNKKQENLSLKKSYDLCKIKFKSTTY